jgi:hypothetical protein
MSAAEARLNFFLNSMGLSKPVNKAWVNPTAVRSLSTLPLVLRAKFRGRGHLGLA